MTTPIYFPISFNPFYNTKKDKIDKRAKLPIGWDKTSATEEGLTNKALLTGKASGISVIDFDNLDSYNKCLELIPELQTTYKVKTKNGFHLYFQYNETLKTTTDCFTLPGIDIRNDGGCAIAPPSSYTFENITYKYEEIKGDIVPIPNELLKLITQKGLKEQEQEEPFIYTPTIEITDLVQLVRMLSVKRATDYTDWRNVGFGLYNILGKDGLNLFIEFSQLSTKHFNYREVYKFYNNITSHKGRCFTERTFHSWAKKDNYEEYYKVFGNVLSWDILTNINHSDIANCYTSLAQQEFVYSHKCWYRWNENNILEKLDKSTPDKLRRDISLTLQKKVKMMLAEHPQDDSYATHCKLVGKVYPILGTVSFINGVIEMLRPLYTDNDLFGLIDANMDLLAFKNCLFDYSIKNFDSDGNEYNGDFRPIQREDFIMNTCGYEINYENDKDTTIQKELNELFTSIYGSEEMKDYVLDTFAMAMFKNSYEKFYCHTGLGGNGKGVIFNLLEGVLGDYYYTAPQEFLTSVFKADAPNSILANTRGIRFLITSEPSTEDTKTNGAIKLNIDLVKSLSGGDTINARDLFESAKKILQFKSTLTPFLQCNGIPALSKVDDGIGRRLQKIDYPYQFMTEENSKYNVNDSSIKLADITLKTKLSKSSYIKNMMFLLLDRVVQFESFKVPSSIKVSTQTFLIESDQTIGWLADFMVYAEEIKKDDNIPPKNAYNMFLTDMGLTKYEYSDRKFYKAMEANKWNIGKYNGSKYYKGLSRQNKE